MLRDNIYAIRWNKLNVDNIYYIMVNHEYKGSYCTYLI